MKKILVTGAGGFLGAHICKYFALKGFAVAAVGRFKTTNDVVTFPPNLKLLGEMTLPDDSFTKLVQQFQPDVLIHCAGTASVPFSVVNPYEDFLKTVNVCAFTLETLRKYAPECAFVLLSSAAVYGNPHTLPIDENQPCKPVSPYGFHKMLTESLTTEYRELFGISTYILRIFSAYGEHLQKQVVFDLCQKFILEKSDEIVVYGTGHETRDFIHAYDVARAIDSVIHTKQPGVFNVASGVQTQIGKVVDLIKKNLSSNKSVRFTNKNRIGDPIYWQADISRLKINGFTPSINLEDGIKNYILWFRANIEGKS